jgi:glutathione S-transferase
MNVRRSFPAAPVSPEATADIARIVTLWAEARSRWGEGGPFLFGKFSAADIMFAPVITRFITYSLPIPRFAAVYGTAVLTHPFVADWLAAAQDEPWVIERFEQPVA